jgi:hypothetical protein
LSDSGLLLPFDLAIEIGKAPAEFGSKNAAYRTLSGCHEAHKKEPGRAL